MSAVAPIVLPGKYINERIVVTCDFARRISQQRQFAGVTLSAPTFVATVLTGVDASPSAIISGSASIDGYKAKQLVINGVDGVTYKLVCTVTTSDGETLIEELDLPVEAP